METLLWHFQASDEFQWSEQPRKYEGMVTDVEMQDDQAEKNCGNILETRTDTLLKHYREKHIFAAAKE